jgi:hypothetical protein
MLVHADAPMSLRAVSEAGDMRLDGLELVR